MKKQAKKSSLSFRHILLIFAAMLLILVGYLAFAQMQETDTDPVPVAVFDRKLEGTVTEYDLSPTFVDGKAIFEIDGVPVDIGGGRVSPIPASFDTQIEVGDEVSAEVVETEDGTYSIIDCETCFVKKK